MYNPNIPCPLPNIFNPAQYELLGGGAAFIKESGKFAVVIVGVEMVAAKNNASHFLQMTYEITAGELKGQSFLDRIHLNNPNQQAREIAYKRLASIAHATGVGQAIQDARVFVGKTMQVYVLSEEQASTTDPNKTVWQNDVKEYFYADGSSLIKGSFGATATAGGQNPQAAPAPNAAPQQAYAPQAPAAAPAPAPAPAPQQQHYAPPAGQPQQQQQQPTIETNVQPQGYAPQAEQQQYAPQQPQQPQQAHAPQSTVPAGATGGYVPPQMPNFAPPQQ